MWSRRLIKFRAKQVVLNGYFTSCTVVLFLSIFIGLRFVQWIITFPYLFKGQILIENLSVGGIFSFIGFSGVFAFILWFLIFIFIEGPVIIGVKRYFIKNTYGNNDIKIALSGFNNSEYISNVESMLITRLFIFLWSLLFIVPGIIKCYAYSMVPYIIAENPKIDYKAALKISKQMTYGHKWNMFVLTLSFFWWYLLGLLLGGIGTVFVRPYIEAAFAQLYLELNFQDD